MDLLEQYKRLLNPYGLLNDKVVYVGDVPSGRDCGCLCPLCHAPLIARKGAVREHHFSHESGSECHAAYETAVHLLCKAILDQKRIFRLPPEPESPQADHQPVYATLDTVEAEVKMGTIRVDVLAQQQGVPLIIEVDVWHKTGREKIAAIEALGISAVEVALHEFRYPESRPDLHLEENLIHKGDNRKWLFNRRHAPRKKTAQSLADTPKQSHSPIFAAPLIIPQGAETPCKFPPGVCKGCGRDVSIAGWVQYHAGTYLCGECNKKKFQQLFPPRNDPRNPEVLSKK